MLDSVSKLIDSDRVNGTRVYSTDGEHVGDIDHLMIDKESGNVAYAVMSFGGFLGMGTEQHPIPWPRLKYDTQLGGYVTGITREDLDSAPARRDGWESDRKHQAEIYSHFNAPWYF